MADTTALGLPSVLAELSLCAEDRLHAQGMLASGGMGAIEIVIDQALRRRLARKVIHESLQSDADAVRRFVREARIIGRLDHPNIVPIHEVGIDSRGRLYFTMKLVSGRTLEALADAMPVGPVAGESLFDLLDVVIRVCDALAFAHSRGVLHCDVKPSNVMVGEFGQVYLMDWGIARVLDDDEDAAPADRSPDADATDPSDSSKTRNAILGSPAYMAPEQAWGRRNELGPAADVYAIGGLVYRAAARRPPHPGDTFIEALTHAQHDEPAPLPADTPPELARIVDRCLARDPADRYASVDAVKQDLVRFVRGGGELPRRRYGAGETVVREGDIGDAAYLIVSGSCDAVRDVDGQRRVLRTMRRSPYEG